MLVGFALPLLGASGAAFSWPLISAFKLSMPESMRDKCKYWFTWNFGMSVAWICILITQACQSLISVRFHAGLAEMMTHLKPASVGSLFGFITVLGGGVNALPTPTPTERGPLFAPGPLFGARTITLWPPPWKAPTKGDAENQHCVPCFVNRAEKYGGGTGVLALALKKDHDASSFDSWQCSIVSYSTGVANPDKLPIASGSSLYKAETKCSGGSISPGGETADELRQTGNVWKLNQAGVNCDIAPVNISSNLIPYPWQGDCNSVGHPGKTFTQQVWSIVSEQKTQCSLSWKKDAPQTPIATGSAVDGNKCTYMYGDQYVNINGGPLTGAVSLKTATGGYYLTDTGSGQCPWDARANWPINGDLGSCESAIGGSEAGFEVTGSLTFGHPPSK
ncbi:hypothetical protein EMIHUDRAFT_240920 [Emiliania huxleyi CCMP1516]|uniref:Uncharacterized protein n=2 Tax=Emiliania huxleyi TaxID=2903 RepID=A0A0D3JE81_EMIH1|nr:hypothetical protein EMIHUDRAFT_240920 [Emiliania huxleyi CCMP1516]EOD21816.1 hypothetical protein EMIHUDRAFT_240920 [Emiliania huxleyi CCMP1516]|eukprot:XP_005774245.1 hypothetical protein EMIHUDRAFT_240920 [Emiliania huxleyi CCMP1516]